MSNKTIGYINWGTTFLVLVLYIGLRLLGFIPFTYYFLLMPLYLGLVLVLKILLGNRGMHFPIAKHILSYAGQLIYAYGYFFNEQAEYDIYCQENNLPMDLEGLAVVFIGIFLHIILYIFIGVVASIVYVLVKKN